MGFQFEYDVFGCGVVVELLNQIKSWSCFSLCCILLKPSVGIIVAKHGLAHLDHS
jgi:hypothetical protein